MFDENDLFAVDYSPQEGAYPLVDDLFITDDYDYGLYGLDTDPGRDIDPDRTRSIFTVPSRPIQRITKAGQLVTYGYTDEENYEDVYSIRRNKVEYDNGEIGYISFGEMNDPSQNPNLRRKINELTIENAEISFDPIEVPRLDEFGTIDIEYPYQKELKQTQQKLIEAKQKGLLETQIPEEYRNWEGDIPPDELVQSYFKYQKLQEEIFLATQSEVDRAIADMSEGEQQATLNYSQLRVDNAAQENLQDDMNSFEATVDTFQNSELYKNMINFENNLNNPDYKFEIIPGEETIELNDGRVISKRDVEEYQKMALNLNIQRDVLKKQLESIIDRQEVVSDSQIELNMLKRNYSLIDKFGFNVKSTFGSLFYGAGEFGNAFANLFREDDVEYENIFGETSAEIRERVQSERESYRPDVKFDDAFSSVNNLGRFLFEETGRQLPIFAIIAASGGTAGLAGAGVYTSAGISATTLGLMTGGQQIGDMTYEEYMSRLNDFDFDDKEYSELNKFFTGTGFGLAEGVLGTAPTFLLGSRFLNNAAKNFINTGKGNILKTQGTEFFKNNFARELGIGIVGEATSEGMTQLTQNAITGRPLLENVGHATFSGGFFGGFLGGGSVAVGAAGRSMMDQDAINRIDNNWEQIKDLENVYNGIGDKRSSDARFIKKKISELNAEIENEINAFENTWVGKMTPKALEDFKQMKINQYKLRGLAQDVIKSFEAGNIDAKTRDEQINALATEYQLYETQINAFKDPKNYANRFEALKVNDKDRYNAILEKAKDNLRKNGTEVTDVNVDKEANKLFIDEEYNKRKGAINKLLKGVFADYSVDTFETDAEARQFAQNVINDPNSTEGQKDFWTKVLQTEKGKLNGFASSVDGVYSSIIIGDSAKNNERSNTHTHEVGHLLFWDKLNIKGSDYIGLAEVIANYTKKYEPEIYNEIFGVDAAQAAETAQTTEDSVNGKKPIEVVMGFLERVNRIKDVKNVPSKNFFYQIGNIISDTIGNREAVDLSSNDNIISFLVELGTKISNGTLTQQDIDNATKNKILDKYRKNVDANVDEKIEASSESENSLFENTELLGGVTLNEDGTINEDTWSNLSENDKINRAQTLGIYWEPFLTKKIKQQITADETEILALLNKFTGLSHNTSESPITESYAAKRGFIDIVTRWNPNKNNSLAAWIQSANNLPMRILELAQTSKTFGRFEDSIDQQVEGKRPIDIRVDENVEFDQVTKQTNEYRKLLNVENNSDLYNKVLNEVDNKLTDNDVKNLVNKNPKKLRQNLKKSFETSLAKDISNIIGTQKSDKFKKFISDKQNLQKIIDLLGVKYRNRFPMFTNDGGRANVAQSKLMQESDQGSFVTDTKAGNQIWIPKDVNNLSNQEIQDIVDNFVQGRETQYKSLKNALANELALDAVFTALENNPNLQAKYDGISGKLAESIKRSPEAAFSLSKSDQTKLIQDYLDIARGPKGTARAEYLKDEFEKHGLMDMYDRAKSYIEDMGLEGKNGFIGNLTSYKLPSDIAKIIRSKELKWVRDGDFKFLDDLKADMLKLSGVLDPRVNKIFGFNFMGVHYRHLDPKKNKGFLSSLNSSMNQNVQNDKHAYLLENIDDVILMVNKGKLAKILDQIYKADKVSEKIKILNDNAKIIQAANNANKNLRNYLALKMQEAKMKPTSIYLMLQSQTNIIDGFRALSTFEHIRLVDGIQTGPKTKTAKGYYDKWSKVVGYNEALKETNGDVDKAITLLKTKNEHLGANSETMAKLGVKLFYGQVKNVDVANDIFKNHISLFSTNQVLNNIDKAGGRTNQAAEFRVNLFMTEAESNNHYNVLGVKSSDYIANKKAREILTENLQAASISRGNLQRATSITSAKRKGISVFDFDDTLAKTKSKIGVTMPSGKQFKIDATEFATTSADLEAAGAEFDFSEFNEVIDGKKGPLADLALKRQNKFGSGDIFVLTARPQEAAYAIHAFLKGIGLNIPIDNITGLEDGRPQAKADWILGKVSEGYNDFYFADDAFKNVKAVKDVLKDVDVKSDIQQAYSKSNIDTFADTMNKIIETQSGVSAEAKFSEIVARRKGANKGKYQIFLPPGSEDFQGLLVQMAGKGEKGSQDRFWLIDNLVKPYFRGVEAINIAKTSLKSDYKKLIKQYPDVAQVLDKQVPGTVFTYDNAIRTYIWNKQNQDIPGISKRDKNKLIKAINSSEQLTEFANNVEKIGNVKNKYLAPDNGWDVETILKDLDNLSNKVGRKEYLQDWINRVEAAFTPDVLNKIEAVYGTRFREALEDILYRMTNGSNRTTGQNRQVNAWLNWINNSVGTIMFFNRRSALLQSISTINFLNWSDNSIIKASMAFANQPQFWKDFAYIWNSPKLKQRRRGLQTDLQWQEIASAAKRGKNSVNSVISWLLAKGFIPTQLVDNFAIAAGGASFYRNRINTYKKQGMSQVEAETKAWEDFSNTAEETQQSGDPALISQEQASVLGRLILSFQNTPMQMTRLQKKAGLMLIRRQRYENMTQTQSDFTNIGKIIYYGAIQNFIFTALQNALFAILPGFDGDETDDIIKDIRKEEEKKARILNNMIDTLLRGSGVKGAVLSTIKNTILRYQKEEKKGYLADHTYTLIEMFNVSPPIGSKARKLYGAQQSRKFNREVLEERGWQVTADGRINLSPAYDIAGNLSSALLNVPLDRVVNELESLVEATDSRNATWQRVALALGWRTWDIGAKNEEEDLIKLLIKLDKKNQKKKKSKKNDNSELDLFLDE